MESRNVIVIGGSAGASTVLLEVFAGLPSDLAASIFVVTHFQARGPSGLKELLEATSTLPIQVAVDGQPIEPGRVYLAARDRHLIVTPSAVRLGAGPHENMMRPAIDPLFRSAALAFGPRVVGLVLSGYLNDGAAGLAAIKARGGLALVQHPLDADVPAMPQAALDSVDVDFALSRGEIAGALERLSRQPAPPVAQDPDPSLELEVRIACGARLGAKALHSLAKPSALSCPHCHGVLSEMQTGGPLRYRCQTGHAFTAEAAFEGQESEIDEALMIALRVMEERATLVSRMAEDARANGRTALVELYERRAREYGRYAATLRDAAIRSLVDTDEIAAE